MYTAKPIGINIKDNDRNAKDGSLQESINLQWRDGSFKPIPERLISDIDATGYSSFIFHKVSDEDKINVLAFSTSSQDLSGDLAFDLAGYLGGEAEVGEKYLTWIGTIKDGVYTSITPIIIPNIVKTDGMSFTILNGLVYFMGDGSSDNERYYQRIQFNESNEMYETKDMYAWKSLVPFYPEQGFVVIESTSKSYNCHVRCGIVLMRFTLVLKTGEEVLHSPIYAFCLNGINQSDTQFKKDDLITNIHTVINLDMEFSNEQLLEKEISSINIYCTVPYYLSKFPVDVVNNDSSIYAISDDSISGEIQRLMETNFYLVRTIESSKIEGKVLLSVGDLSSELTLKNQDDITSINIDTIAAGQVMPIDNFTYHKLYGSILSANGRIIIENPTTVLAGGHLRAVKTNNQIGVESYRIDTEDGEIIGTTVLDDKNFEFTGLGLKSRGVISYPDTRANLIFATKTLGTLNGHRSRGNKLHNISCAFVFNSVGSAVSATSGGGTATFTSEFTSLLYYTFDVPVNDDQSGRADYYTSENRAQFSEVGESSVWPAINSYRIGNGKIMKIGNNSVDPSNADIIAPLIVGTTDGVFTINFDPTGENLISSITKTKNIPYISKEVLQIDGSIVFVSDKGLMVINNGEVINLTEKYFPDQGNGDFPLSETVYPNYNLLTNSYFGGPNPYVLDDIVSYMKGALLSYDSRRNNLWCCNPAYNFSMVYNIKTNMWGMSTIVFSEAYELSGILDTAEGDVYSRFLIKGQGSNLLILSGENSSSQVFFHMMSRPMKIQSPDNYKKLRGLFARCQLFRDESETGYFRFGAWGKQDHNKLKKSIPITAKADNRTSVYPNNVRQDIPIGRAKGKYKSITILIGGVALPDSSIDSVDFDELLLENFKIR